MLQQYGAQDVSIAGYPEGHPDISDEKLWAAITGKHATLTEQGIKGGVDFDVWFGLVAPASAKGKPDAA